MIYPTLMNQLSIVSNPQQKEHVYEVKVDKFAVTVLMRLRQEDILWLKGNVWKLSR